MSNSQESGRLIKEKMFFLIILVEETFDCTFDLLFILWRSCLTVLPADMNNGLVMKMNFESNLFPTK